MNREYIESICISVYCEQRRREFMVSTDSPNGNGLMDCVVKLRVHFQNNTQVHVAVQDKYKLLLLELEPNESLML